MAENITFGTAGVRGPIGPGPSDMNVTTVSRVTAGVAQWAKNQGLTPQHSDGVFRIAVGYDARYGSHSFARAAAEVFAAAGAEVTLLADPAPTPVLAWVVKDRNCDGGVQITASHNPAGDNGYKLYLAGGSQLVSPADREIEAAIAAQPTAAEIPRSEVTRTDSSVIPAYAERISRLVATGRQVDLQPRRELTIAYTALHGVGGNALEWALRQAGFGTVSPVASQRWPDPEFPTVAFPNPEEPGATDELVRHGEAIGADVLIALDPDADRCQIGVPLPRAAAVGEQAPGVEYRMLTGDQLGALLATRIVAPFAPADSAGQRDSRGAADEAAPVVATTVVSSQLLGRIAAASGWDYVETLTGFKNLSRAADARPGRLAFAYEEAIGTCPAPDVVADKDGIATAVLVAAWAAELKAEGSDLWSQWLALEERYGVFRTAQVSVRVESPAAAGAIVEGFATNPPAEIAGMAVTAEPIADTFGTTTSGVRLWLAETNGWQARIVARPSGTEPKAKFYVEVFPAAIAAGGTHADSGNIATQRTEADALLEAVCADLRARVS